MTGSSRCVLVTGASSGIGEATARRLAADGLRVFGGSRRPPTKADAGFEPIVLDVTSDDSVRAAVDSVVAQAGRLDVVVNNAGAMLIGALEETSADEARGLLETNLLGAHRVTRAALPHLRASRGHLVLMGSVAGFVALPSEGFYSASKHALEGYADTLRIELAPFGVRVALVEPGFVRTRIAVNARAVAAPLALYDPMRRALAEQLAHDVERGADPAVVAVCVSRIVASKAPRARYLVGRGAVPVRWLKSLLPAPWFEWGLRRRFRPR